ncbi:hypothetical protein [Paucibacter soli]|uniref:hypothetical protein n=1 Tax=Paucibacter soli TaxID=3133433 RepID=UPI0030A56068
MERKPLFGARAAQLAQQEAADMASGIWASWLCDAIRKHKYDDMLTLLRGSDRFPRPREAVLAGLKLDGIQGNSSARMLAQVCMDSSNVHALALIAEQQPSGITLADCCRSYVKSGVLEVSSDLSLLQLSMKYGNAEALRLALKYESGHPCVSGTEDIFRGGSVHYEALREAVTSTNCAASALYAKCCRVALEFGLPFAHTRAEGVSTMSDLFFRNRWNRDHLGAVLVPLLADYVKAGLLDLDAVNTNGHRPVAAAIFVGNGEAAAAAIDLGCDLKGAIQGTAAADLLALAGEQCTGEAVAQVTAALMRRQVRNPAAQEGTKLATIQPSRRAARIGL